MKVAVDGLVFEAQAYGGISRIFCEILPGMCKLDETLQVSLLTCGPLMQQLPLHPQIQPKPLPYWEGFLRPGRLFWRFRRDIRTQVQSSWVRKNQPEIWHSTYYSFPGRWLGPVVINVYDLIHEQFLAQYNTAQYDAFRSQKREAIKRADIVICISETTKKDVQQFYDIDSSRIVVIPLAVSTEFKRYGTEISPMKRQRPFLLYVGKRAGYKNFETLLTAYSRWPQSRRIDLLVVGSPWTPEERQRIQILKVADQVRLDLAVTDQRLAQYYSQAVAFVHPSLYEGFGLPLLEALSCGCPLVVSSIPSSVEVAGGAACYFDPQDADQLIQALDQVVQNGRSAPFLQQARKEVGKYSWEKSANQTLKVYRALV